MPKISIIIPVYNAENEICKAIDSIINQTLKDLQIILIDDGSKDNSLAICKEYEKKDERIKVIHQDNAGVSVARNRGIDNAEGEYIGFVDSDDWIDPDMYENLLYEAEKTKSDVVMCDAMTVYSNGIKQPDTITQLKTSQILKKDDFTPNLLLEMAGSVWRCIYKNNRYNAKLNTKNEQLQFSVGVKFSEDRIFNIYAFGQANQIAYIKKAYYNRYVNKKSAVHRFHEDYFEACKKAADNTSVAIKKAWENNQQLQTAYLKQLILGAYSSICNYYYKASTLSKKERRKKIIDLCNDKQLRTAIEVCGLADRKGRWILERKYLLLIGYAKMANLKYRR